MMQNVLAIVVRKNTTSIAGISETCFTKTLASEKASVDKNIARTPSVRNLSSLFNWTIWLFGACRASTVVSAGGTAREQRTLAYEGRRRVDNRHGDDHKYEDVFHTRH